MPRSMAKEACVSLIKAILWILFLLTVSTNATNAEERKFNVLKGSLLLFLDMLSDSALYGNQRNSTGDEYFGIRTECQKRTFSYTIYYNMVYFRLCHNFVTTQTSTIFGNSRENQSAFDNFCELLEQYDRIGSSNLTNTLDDVAQEFSLFGNGIQSDLRWLGLHACKCIQSYYKEKKSINTRRDTLEQRIYPNYTEWFVYTVPFATPTACGFTRNTYDKHLHSTSFCLAPTSKGGLYLTFIIDGLILIAIVIANIDILVVSWRTKSDPIFRHSRVSLAIADLFIGVIMVGAIFTTYTMYFGEHKFTEEGHSPSMLDYHTQAYVNGFGTFTILSFSSSIFTLVVASVDRFVVIFRPLRYKRHIKKIKIWSVVMIVSSWILSLILAILPLFNVNTQYSVTALGVIIAPDYFVVYLALLGSALLIMWVLNLISFCYVRIYMQNRRKQLCRDAVYSESGNTRNGNFDNQQMHEVDQSNASNFAVAAQCKMTRKEGLCREIEVYIAATVRVIVLGFTLATIPSIAVMILGRSMTLNPISKTFNPEEKAVWNSFAYFASRILFANSFFNCIIYKCRNKKIHVRTGSTINSVISTIGMQNTAYAETVIFS